jgi:hypothetical protein
MRIRRLTAVAAASALTAGALALTTPAAAAPSGSLTVWSTQTEQNKVDVGATGLTTGDITTGSGTVAMTQTGKAAGTFAYAATTVRVGIPGGNSTSLTTSVYTLPKGTISLQGLISVPQGTPPVKTETFVIVGGTGAYAGARGVAVRNPGPTTWKVTFTFVS